MSKFFLKNKHLDVACFMLFWGQKIIFFLSFTTSNGNTLINAKKKKKQCFWSYKYFPKPKNKWHCFFTPKMRSISYVPYHTFQDALLFSEVSNTPQVSWLVVWEIIRTYKPIHQSLKTQWDFDLYFLVQLLNQKSEMYRDISNTQSIDKGLLPCMYSLVIGVKILIKKF